MNRRVAVAALVVAGCNQLLGLDAPAGDDTAGDDGGPGGDGGGSAWRDATPVAVAATVGVAEDDPALTPDGTELYFGHEVAGAKDLHVARRATGTDGWLPATVSELSSMAVDSGIRFDPAPSPLTAYFASTRGGGALDIYRATRAAMAFDLPVAFDPLNDSIASDSAAAPCAGATRFVVASTRGGASADLWEIVPGQTATRIEATTTAGNETGPFLTEDCLRLYYASNVRGTFDLYVVARGAIGAPWGMPAMLAELSTTGFNEGDPWLSADERHILFATDAAGSFDVVEARR